jgi:hypothetical protein
MEQTQEHLSKVATENTERKEKLAKVIADNQAICEFAGFQPFIDAEEMGIIFYLSAKIVEDSVVGLSIEKATVTKENAIYVKDEVLTALKKEMESTFPEHVIDTNGIDEEKIERIVELTKERIANRVTMQTRRGAAKTKFIDFLYYKGSNPADCPFIVYKFGDKYGIFKHPKADQYGFRLIYK